MRSSGLMSTECTAAKLELHVLGRCDVVGNIDSCEIIRCVRSAVTEGIRQDAAVVVRTPHPRTCATRILQSVPLQRVNHLYSSFSVCLPAQHPVPGSIPLARLLTVAAVKLIVLRSWCASDVRFDNRHHANNDGAHFLLATESNSFPQFCNSPKGILRNSHNH